MLSRTAAVAFALIGCGTAAGHAAPAAPTASSSTEEVTAYIDASERAWAAAVASGDVSVLQTIIAEDMVGMGAEAQFFPKAGLLAEVHGAPQMIASNKMDDIKIRFFGKDTAVAQGVESFTQKAGEPKQARFVFTDTWVMRDNKWQVVATEAVIAPPASP